MTTKLDALLASIRADRTIMDTERTASDAVSSFRLHSVSINSWEAFKACASRIHCHVENCVLGIDPPREVEPALDFGLCCQVLAKIFGTNGEKIAAHIAMTGVEGGLPKILRDIAFKMAEEYSSNEIRARVSDYWDSLSVEEKLVAPDEFLAKYGRFLPRDVTQDNAPGVRISFPTFLQQFPLLDKKSREVAR